jgi:hypothetical protein
LFSQQIFFEWNIPWLVVYDFFHSLQKTHTHTNTHTHTHTHTQRHTVWRWFDQVNCFCKGLPS